MQLRHLRGEQWVQLAANSASDVNRLNATPFALAILPGRSAGAAPRVTSCTTLRSTDWIGGTIRVVDQVPGWGLLRIDALFASPDRIALIRLPAGAWAATVLAPSFPFALLVGRDSKRPSFEAFAPGVKVERAIEVMELPSLNDSGWNVTSNETGHAGALEDCLLVSGPAEFLVARSDSQSVDALGISFNVYDPSTKSVVSITQSDLLVGSLDCDSEGADLRVRFDGVAVIQMHPRHTQALRKARGLGHEAIRLEGAVVNRRLTRCLLSGRPPPRRHQSGVTWPGHYGFGLRDAGLGFVAAQSC